MAILLTAFVSFALFFGLFMAYLVPVFVCIIGGVYFFCLQPDKAEYEFHFSETDPIQVTVLASGSLVVSATDPEYLSLKEAVVGREMTEGANLT